MPFVRNCLCIVLYVTGWNQVWNSQDGNEVELKLNSMVHIKQWSAFDRHGQALFVQEVCACSIKGWIGCPTTNYTLVPSSVQNLTFNPSSVTILTIKMSMQMSTNKRKANSNVWRKFEPDPNTSFLLSKARFSLYLVLAGTYLFYYSTCISQQWHCQLLCQKIKEPCAVL